MPALLLALAFFVWLPFLTLLLEGVQYFARHPTQRNPNYPPSVLASWSHMLSGGWAWLGQLVAPASEGSITVVDRTPQITFPSRTAGFGPRIGVEGDPLLGYLIPLNSFATPCDDPGKEGNTACPQLCITGPHEPDASDAWIALVQRGECPFVDKVREAQRLGAVGVVVGGFKPPEGYQDDLVQMYAETDANDIRIPSTYVTYSSYTRIERLIETSNTTTSGLRTISLSLNAEYAAWEWYSPLVTFLLLLLLPSLLTLLTVLIHRIRLARAARADRAPAPFVYGLAWSVWGEHGLGIGEEDHALHAQPEKPAEVDSETAGTAQQPGDSPTTLPSTSAPPPPPPPWFATQARCAICLADFARGDRVRILPCRHIFHLEEVDVWLIERKKLCPICKADVTAPARAKALESSVRRDAPWYSRWRRRTVSTATGSLPDERTPLLAPPARADTREGPV